MNRTTINSVAAALGLAIAGLTFVQAPAFAYDPASPSAINVDQKGIALRGYDPVAYFTAGKPMQGSARYAVNHQGVTYHFANAENMKRFSAAPATYMPAFGGFCAMGVALEKKLDGDPQVWKIVDGKLYLNVNADVQKAWSRDIPGNIATANENWPAIKDMKPSDLA